MRYQIKERGWGHRLKSWRKPWSHWASLLLLSLVGVTLHMRNNRIVFSDGLFKCFLVIPLCTPAILPVKPLCLHGQNLEGLFCLSKRCVIWYSLIFFLSNKRAGESVIIKPTRFFRFGWISVSPFQSLRKHVAALILVSAPLRWIHSASRAGPSCSLLLQPRACTIIRPLVALWSSSWARDTLRCTEVCQMGKRNTSIKCVIFFFKLEINIDC